MPHIPDVRDHILSSLLHAKGLERTQDSSKGARYFLNRIPK
jgi:hypothetical protein